MSQSSAPRPRRRSWLFLLGIVVGACGGGGSEDGSAVESGRAAAGRGGTSRADVWLRDVADSAGLRFVHRSGHREEYYLPEIVSGGVALLDMDGDGFLDIYLVQAGSLTEPAGERLPNLLFRNQGDGTFEDVTPGSGAGDRGFGMGAATGDYDNDGHIDLYVTNAGRNTLLRNQGDGTFSDVTDIAGVGDPGFGSSAAFVDYDADGDLDLFVANYVIWSVETERDCFSSLGQKDYCAPAKYNAPAIDVLYRNEGDGTFTDVTQTAGIASAFGTGLGVVCGDFTGDGLVDIFVANDGRPDQMWVNLGDGRFEDRGLLTGCAMDESGTPKAGMGVSAADIDNDGDLDLLVSNIRGESDSLFLNGGTFFLDSSAASGLVMSSRSFTRFGTAWVDFDNDGLLDLYQANGRVSIDVDRHDPDDPFAEPNLLYRSEKIGRFEEVALRGGTDPLLIHTSRGAAFGDLDNDGGIDVVIMNRDAAPYLLKNVRENRGNWLLVRVVDEHGRDALGATVAVALGDRVLRRDVRTAYSYCAASDHRVHFGLGTRAAVDRLEVTWPDGLREEFDVTEVNRIIEVRRRRSAAGGDEDSR